MYANLALTEPLLQEDVLHVAPCSGRVFVFLFFLIGLGFALLLSWVPGWNRLISEESAISLGVLDYSKWEKFSLSVKGEESEEEDEIRETNPEFLEKKFRFLPIPPKPYIPGGKFQGKEKLMSLVGTWPEIATVGMKEDAESLEKLFREFAQCGDQDSKFKLQQIFGWKGIETNPVTGYCAKEGKRWHVFHDEYFTETQTQENPAAVNLAAGNIQAKGWFVIACIQADPLHEDTSKETYMRISRREVANLIFDRESGKDSKKIHEERIVKDTNCVDLQDHSTDGKLESHLESYIGGMPDYDMRRSRNTKNPNYMDPDPECFSAKPRRKKEGLLGATPKPWFWETKSNATFASTKPPTTTAAYEYYYNYFRAVDRKDGIEPWDYR